MSILALIKRSALALLLINFLVSCDVRRPAEHKEEGMTISGYPNPKPSKNLIVDYTKWEIKDGKFYLDGQWTFLKIGKQTTDLSKAAEIDRIIASLDTLYAKRYNVVALSCSWHTFDINGDGKIDISLEPLNKLIDAIYVRGMFPMLAVGTYSVGGPVTPPDFFVRHPDAYAINDKGKRIIDTEYAHRTDVPSLFHPEYLKASRNFIKNLARGLDTRKILFFSTTVEPQYSGVNNFCFSEAARTAYKKWRKEHNIADEASAMPTEFPIPPSFVKNETWNKFRAQWLAEWINGDIEAYRSVAGPDAYVGVDYLDASEASQIRRTGEPLEFLKHITGHNVIMQVNWHWNFIDDMPNQKAYDRVWEISEKYGKNWVISEHMTMNGKDYNKYDDDQLREIMENTLEQGTRFGWEFVHVTNRSHDEFSMYNDDWSPKRVIKFVDDHWGYWLDKVEAIENAKR